MKKLYLLIILFLVAGSISAQEKLSKEEQARRQKNIDAANPFKQFGYKAKVATLSKGKYLEVHDLDSIVTIGSIRFHVDKKEIVGNAAQDTINGMYARPIGDMPSRWLSPDPLSEEFTSWSPYNMCFDNPMRFVDPDGKGPLDWIKNTATGDIVWRAGVTSAANTPTGYSYVGKDYNGLSIQSYGAHSTSGVGVEISASYSDGQAGTANAQYVQTITTNAPLGGATSPYNDPQPGDDNKPFYYTDAELPGQQNIGGQDLDFYDRPTRSASATGTTWNGELTLATDSGTGFKPVVTVSYGFEVKGGVAVPTELKVNPTESAFQTKTINDYNQTMVGPRLPNGTF